jgi:murein DD-endopeptidase MepM/ murein hydrolase activator NlpD
MSKFYYLLISIVFISSCAHRQGKVEKIVSEPVVAEPAITVDKDSNSIRITQPEVTAQNKKQQSPPQIKVKHKFQFDWPIWEARMTRGFLPHGTKRRKRPHKGIDLAAPRGTAVMASHDGKVIYTGKGFKGYGKMIMLESPTGWATLYGHLDKIIVSEGMTIKQGEVIGALGNTGRSSGPHLHFEIRKLDGPVDPLPLLPAGEALTNEVDNGSADE